MTIHVLIPEGKIRDQFLPPENRELLRSLGEVVWNPGEVHYKKEELPAIMEAADVLVTGWGCPRIEGHVLADGRPRLMAHTGGTVAPYVDGEVFNRGMRVVCANEIYAKSVAEGVMAYILSSLRRIPYWDSRMKQGGWRTESFSNFSLFGKKVGLVGYGAVTRHLLPLLRAFETEVSLFSTHLTENACRELGATKAPLEEIFSTCDIISLHSALTASTHHMVDARLLQLLKDGAFLINTARGAVIDEAALIVELKARPIHAVLDVYETEPLPDDSPLRKLDNVILIPHMAGPTADLRKEAAAAVILEIPKWRCGEELRHEVPQQAIQHMTQNG